LRLFFSANSEKIYKFSNRQGKNTSYCLYEDYDYKKIINNLSLSDRRWALNLNSSCDTIELRLFRGTLEHDRFIANLQFADAVSHFVKEIGISAFIIGEHKYKNNSWLLFIDWCRYSHKYNHLIKFLEKEQLCV